MRLRVYESTTSVSSYKIASLIRLCTIYQKMSDQSSLVKAKYAFTILKLARKAGRNRYGFWKRSRQMCLTKTIAMRLHKPTAGPPGSSGYSWRASVGRPVVLQASGMRLSTRLTFGTGS